MSWFLEALRGRPPTPAEESQKIEGEKRQAEKTGNLFPRDPARPFGMPRKWRGGILAPILGGGD